MQPVNARNVKGADAKAESPMATMRAKIKLLKESKSFTENLMVKNGWGLELLHESSTKKESPQDQVLNGVIPKLNPSLPERSKVLKLAK